jgi:hypothetical protein
VTEQTLPTPFYGGWIRSAKGAGLTLMRRDDQGMRLRLGGSQRQERFQ